MNKDIKLESKNKNLICNRSSQILNLEEQRNWFLSNELILFQYLTF